VVNPGRRFKPAEEQESLYGTNVKLTIKTVKKSDYGNYTCHARNSFGSVKGVIALKGEICLRIQVIYHTFSLI
jgi:hypothetical protein